jgi:hypothetical protein
VSQPVSGRKLVLLDAHLLIEKLISLDLLSRIPTASLGEPSAGSPKRAGVARFGCRGEGPALLVLGTATKPILYPFQFSAKKLSRLLS